jgi:hypothetical protein
MLKTKAVLVRFSLDQRNTTALNKAAFFESRSSSDHGERLWQLRERLILTEASGFNQGERH